MNELGALLLAHIPELVMMCVGFILLVVEMYVPGFGLPGISGTVLMILSIISMQPTPLQALIISLVDILLLCIAFSIAMHSISKGRLSRSRLVLNAVLKNEVLPEENDLEYFIGKEGITHTALRPAGIGEFEGVKLNIVSDGDFVPVNAKVRIISVDGNRIVVSEIKE